MNLRVNKNMYLGYIIAFFVAIFCTQTVNAQKSADKKNHAQELFQKALDNEFDIEECPEVVTWLEESAKLGNADAQFTLGLLSLDEESGFAYNIKKGLALLEKAAAQNHGPAKLQLGKIALDNEDFNKAFKLFNDAYKAGKTEAATSLGVLFQEGLGATQDLAKAKEYYEIGVRGGDTDAMNNLAYLYANGQGCEKNLNKAMELIDQAIENADEHNKINFLDSKGEFYLIQGDEANALKIWKQIINLDYNAAQALRSAESQLENYVSELATTNTSLGREKTLALLQAMANPVSLSTLATSILDLNPVLKDVDTDKIEYLLLKNWNLDTYKQEIFGKVYEGFTDEELAECLHAHLLQLPMQSTLYNEILTIAMMGEIVTMASEQISNPNDTLAFLNHKWGSNLPKLEDAEYEAYATRYLECTNFEGQMTGLVKQCLESMPVIHTTTEKAIVESMFKGLINIHRVLLSDFINKDDIKWLSEFYSSSVGKHLTQNTTDAANMCTEKLQKILTDIPDNEWKQIIDSISQEDFQKYKFSK